MPNTLAIDFGTSNSAAGMMIDGAPQLVRVEGAHTTLPTSLFFDAETRRTLFGRQADQALISRTEGRFMRALKSVLGTSIMHEPRYLHGRRVTFTHIIADFLRHLKEMSEAQFGCTFDHALSGRPVHFHSDNADKDARALADLTQCYEAAGFAHVAFMTEPEAAALAARRGGSSADAGLSLIVDIGGGTSDFCLFGDENGAQRVLATGGVRVGGTDFDRRLSTRFVMPLLGRGHAIAARMGKDTLPAPNWIFDDLATWEKIPGLYAAKPRALAAQLRETALDPAPFTRLNRALSHELGHDIAFAVEAGKIEANAAGRADIGLPFQASEPGSRLQVELDRCAMNDALARYGSRIAECAERTLDSAGVVADEVDQLIFVGGSSLMRFVEESLLPVFPKARLHYGDAATAIVDGLVIAAAD